jgi:CspA family cold shock protein
MNIATFIRSIFISIVIAVLAVMLHARSFSAPLDNLPLLLSFTLAVLAGAILTLLMNRSPVARTPRQRSTVASGDFEMGTVKWFNVRKGYGFITRDQGDDVFVHFRNIEGTGRRAISEGQRVQFRVTTGDKGLQADEVSAVD